VYSILGLEELVELKAGLNSEKRLQFTALRATKFDESQL